MPLLVSQGNIFTAVGACVFGGLVTFTAVGRGAAEGSVVLAITISYGLLALWFTQPLNPYRKFLSRGPEPEGHWSLVERRVLAAAYSPTNRRRSVASVIAGGAVVAAAHLILKFVGPAPVGKAPDALDTVVGVAVPGLVVGAWLGFFGLTLDIRRHWLWITSEGPAWRADVRFPGPRREVFRSLFTGRIAPGLMEAANRETPQN